MWITSATLGFAFYYFSGDKKLVDITIENVAD